MPRFWRRPICWCNSQRCNGRWPMCTSGATQWHRTSGCVEANYSCECFVASVCSCVFGGIWTAHGLPICTQFASSHPIHRLAPLIRRGD
jgi:hypothetical protein